MLEVPAVHTDFDPLGNWDFDKNCHIQSLTFENVVKIGLRLIACQFHFIYATFLLGYPFVVNQRLLCWKMFIQFKQILCNNVNYWLRIISIKIVCATVFLS